MKSLGYVFDIWFVMYDLDDEGKEWVVCYYSEKFVIVYGFISMFFGILICIFKNFWVCIDCYIVMKFILKIIKCEIIVRDVYWFYYFKNGECFCGDYW